MPATRRTSRRAESRQPLQTRPTTEASGIIYISSDDESTAPKKPAVPRRHIKDRSKQRTRATAPPSGEILEISSGDERPSPVPPVSVASLQRLLKDANEEIERLKQQLQHHAQTPPPPPPAPAPVTASPPSESQGREIQRLKHALTRSQRAEEKSKALLSALDDHVSCEICTCKMWVPYTLCCGHTFCETCLQDWFSTILAQHMNAHPDYDPRPRALRAYLDALRNPGIPAQTRQQIEQAIAAYRARHPAPQYTCPTCRLIIKDRPAEVFALKHVVHSVSAAQGEQPPKRLPQKAALLGNGPWDGFFPGF
ncbi:hypothetical protein OBBRIDRAFT_505794 [Obba rivulosa]|uniref:RING-type domain-containing protein n=1 Tax=Obba rivulosa TaxID=1052685 RepID=A0A8E2AVL7_9APHY|nr:hypothetical protein OBBRIDRAFT_505794 [Obba rivulosa]